MPTFAPPQPKPGTSAPDLAKLIEPFEKAWSGIRRDPALVRVRSQLVEMLSRDPPAAPIQYPPNPGGEPDRNFGWFIDNRIAGCLLPDPLVERETPARRLPLRPTRGAR